LNIKLINISVIDPESHPHMVDLAARVPILFTHALFSAQNSVKNCFIRGSVVRYVQIPKAEVDTGQRIFVVLSVAQDSVICVELLENSTRIEIREQKKLAEAADAQRAAGGAAAAAGAAK
jgi:hypothetical protein